VNKHFTEDFIFSVKIHMETFHQISWDPDLAPKHNVHVSIWA